MLTIHNAHLKASISTLGAEMHALTVIDSGRSIIWHGDETFWRGHSPILFPLVGSAWNGTLRHEGREYHLPKHGKNPSTRSTMWFQIGGHPSIMLPTPLRAEGDQLTQEVNPFSLVPSPAAVNNKPVGYLRFEGTPHSLLRASTQGCTEPQRVHIPWNKDAATSKALASNHHFNALVPLTIDTFAHEALIFDQHQVTAIHVLDAKEQRIARVVSSAPAWLVWAPTNLPSPFICCEPWYGLPDQQGFLGDWQDRPHVQHASPGTTWHGWYNIEV